MKQIGLVDFISFLNTRGPKDFNQGTTIHSYLEDHALNLDDFNPFVFFREEAYGRNLVARGEHFELLVLTWLPQQRTPIHDHNEQRCWMVMHSGKLTLKNFKPPTPGDKLLVPSGPAATFSAGETVYIDDSIGVHSIANASTKPAVSIHLYAAPIETCRIYDESKSDFEWADLNYFTDPMGLTS